MKSLKLYSILSLYVALLATVLVVSCSQELDTEELPALDPIDQDVDAETWAPIAPATMTLTSIKAIAESSPVIFDVSAGGIAAVQNVNAATYQAELEAIKDAQSKLTGEQKEAIQYWSGGGVLRWNQILRGLVARYNLPPAPKPDDTYPIPDAENPFADPNFPFANPPYAARAYSYVSVAQYEALKTAWHYMHLYDRPAPYETDSGIKSLMPETGLPSYPSYDAVLSGATAEILKLLFPAAVEEITLKAAEQRNTAIWSGKATATDVSKGLALGKAVANVFIARARGDKMGAAVGNKTVWDALPANATVRGDVAWLSLDIPARPPMLPLFKDVTPWIMTSGDVVSIRPVPPPIAGDAEMNKEVEEVKWYSTHLTRERLAIVHKWADGAGTYTPPGHWNDIAAEYVRDANFSEVRAARAFALLNLTEQNAAIACWDTKYFYYNARPSQLDPSIKTGTGIPNFPSYVSGHSTFSGAAATILSYLFPSHTEYLNDQATEASLSRLYGGIHYRKDCENGIELGKDVAAFAVTFAQGDGAD